MRDLILIAVLVAAPSPQVDFKVFCANGYCTMTKGLYDLIIERLRHQKERITCA